MQDDDSRPWDVDPAGYTHALRAARRAALAARARLQAEAHSEQDLENSQKVLREKVLPALANEYLWRALAELEREQTRAAAERPDLAGQQPNTLSIVVDELLGDANYQSPDAVLHGTDPHNTIAGRAHLHVIEFKITVSPWVQEPVPPADDPGRDDWIQGIKAVLDKAVDMLLNLAVAAAFTVTAVQQAAQRAVVDTAEAAGRALEYAGQAWPSMVAIGAVALQAAVGVSLAKQAWDSVQSARAEAATAARLDDYDRAPAADDLERGAASRASEPPAEDDRGAGDRQEVYSTAVADESPYWRGDDDRQPIDDRETNDRQRVHRTTPVDGRTYERPADQRPRLPDWAMKEYLRFLKEGAVSNQPRSDKSQQERRSGGAPGAR